MIRAAVVTALLSGPAVATDAARVWQTFAETCGPLIARPGAATLSEKLADGTAFVAATADGAITVGAGEFPELKGGAVLGVSMNFGVERAPGGQVGTCTLTVIGHAPAPLPGIAEAAEAGTPALLGPEVARSGGRVFGGPPSEAPERAVLWAEPGWPAPRAVRLHVFNRLVMLSLQSFEPAHQQTEGN